MWGWLMVWFEGSGSDIAVEALRRWLSRPGSQPSRLLSMANVVATRPGPAEACLQVLL